MMDQKKMDMAFDLAIEDPGLLRSERLKEVLMAVREELHELRDCYKELDEKHFKLRMWAAGTAPDEFKQFQIDQGEIVVYKSEPRGE